MTKKKKDQEQKIKGDSEVIQEIAEQEENSFKNDPADESAIIEEEQNNMFMDDFEDEEDDTYNDTEGLLTDEKYDVLDDADAFVDTESGKVIKRENMTPWEIIKSIAKENGVDIRDPDKSCKHCYGRGYEGIEVETKMPHPCRCLYRGRNEDEKESESLYDSNKLNRKFSRNQRRQMAKYIKSQFRKEKRENARRKKNGLPEIKENQEEKKEMSNRQINKILREYIKKESFKKTASSLG
ncbi:MAG: hypothetical protein ACOC5T_05940, partial [Elusimicrobiota bacterium]